MRRQPARYQEPFCSPQRRRIGLHPPSSTACMPPSRCSRITPHRKVNKRDARPLPLSVSLPAVWRHSRYDLLGSCCSALEGRFWFPAHPLCTRPRIAMSSHKTMSSCSHSKKSPSLSHRDLQRHGAKGAGGAGKKEKSGFGSTPSWMNNSIKPGQFAGEHGMLKRRGVTEPRTLMRSMSLVQLQWATRCPPNQHPKRKKR